ncbi:hypothetical protein KIL84_018563 [Mauremys mutica]|uniref:Uncharacterized protein n=1 Tax=Mauremys mutica TaxID=74926 RepID=A0A9D3XQL3_9SAUR|nr:hypothetical protein KIL84_018563 [Mauremys mutica]
MHRSEQPKGAAADGLAVNGMGQVAGWSLGYRLQHGRGGCFDSSQAFGVHGSLALERGAGNQCSWLRGAVAYREEGKQSRRARKGHVGREAPLGSWLPKDLNAPWQVSAAPLGEVKLQYPCETGILSSFYSWGGANQLPSSYTRHLGQSWSVNRAPLSPSQVLYPLGHPITQPRLPAPSDCQGLPAPGQNSGFVMMHPGFLLPALSSSQQGPELPASVHAHSGAKIAGEIKPVNICLALCKHQWLISVWRKSNVRRLLKAAVKFCTMLVPPGV